MSHLVANRLKLLRRRSIKHNKIKCKELPKKLWSLVDLRSVARLLILGGPQVGQQFFWVGCLIKA
jgi:hypothetical protein